MIIKRFVLCIAVVVLGLSLAATAQAKKFALTGGGGQLHIGNGLMLPIQAAATAVTTGTVFPNLKVPVRAGPTPPIVSGTVTKPLLTAMATPAGPVTKSGYQRQLSVGTAVLTKPEAQTVVGGYWSNPNLFAVASGASYAWPAAAAVFSTGNAVPTTTVAGQGGTLTYSNALGARFGGPAQFRLSKGAPTGNVPSAGVTVFARINTQVPPCTHTAFGGSDPNCVAGLLAAGVLSTALLGQGASTAAVVTSPGGPIAPNVAVLKVGTSPPGTILAAVNVATNTAIPTNMAVSQGGPWTTGQIIVSQPAAIGGLEKFTLSGKDSRTLHGAGTIQMVSGSLSTRPATGPNGNRGWIELTLKRTGGGVPMLSPSMQVIAIAMLLLAGSYAAYALRRVGTQTQ